MFSLSFYSFDDPVPVVPGDLIRTTCTYNTEDKIRTIFYGDSTAEEMCYGFLYYYPKEVQNEYILI